MKSIQINKWPVIIVANYRTGSTVYATHLAKHYNVTLFLEPWHQKRNRGPHWGPHVNGLKKDFYNHYHSNDNRYILKFMPDQINKFTPYDKLLKSNCYKIKLYRESDIDSVVSKYVASMKEKWWTSSDESVQKYTLDIDNDMILSAISNITQNNFWLNELNVDYDEVITYESLGIITTTEYVKTYMPDNIADIRNRVIEIYNNLY